MADVPEPARGSVVPGRALYEDEAEVERALEAGVDGLILVCAGAGGHAGTMSPFALVGEIDRSHLDDDAVLLGDPVGQRPQHVLAPGGDDQVMPSCGELEGQRLADGDAGERARHQRGSVGGIAGA